VFFAVFSTTAVPARVLGVVSVKANGTVEIIEGNSGGLSFDGVAFKAKWEEL